VKATRAAITTLLLLVGCADLASTRDVRMTLLDAEGRPVPGAIFYAEAREPGGEPFAFFAYEAGPSGAVPDQAREAAKIGWRPGAEVVMAAFAPGYSPVLVLPGSEPKVPLEGGILTLERGFPEHPYLGELKGLLGESPPAAGHVPPTVFEPLIDLFRLARRFNGMSVING
jgi:hypothetical protein